MKKYVLNNKCFTLLEALVGIFVMGVLLYLCMNFIIILNDNQDYSYAKEETTLFISQVQEDFLSSVKVNVKKEQLKFITYNKDKITYEVDKDRLVRKVEGKGYEIVLSSVSSLSFKRVKNNVEVSIKYTDGYNYEGVLGSVK